MNETPFFMTRMGHTYYEHTLPELVRQLERLNEVLEKLAARNLPTGSTEDRDGTASS